MEVIGNYPYNVLEAIGIDTLRVEKKGFAERYENVLLKLSDRQKTVLIQYYKYNQTLDTIADSFNVTRERIRQLLKKAESILKDNTSYLLHGFNVTDNNSLQVQYKLQEINALEQQLILLRRKIYEAKGILFGDYIDGMIATDRSVVDMDKVKNRYDMINIDSLQLNKDIKEKLAKKGIIRVGQLIKYTKKGLSSILHVSDIAIVEKELEKWGTCLNNDVNPYMKPNNKIGKDSVAPNSYPQKMKKDIQLKQLYDKNSMSTRSYNALYRAGVYTLSDLTLMYIEDIERLRNAGKKSVDEIKEIAAKYNIKLFSIRDFNSMLLPKTLANESLSMATQIYCTENHITMPFELIVEHRIDKLTDRDRAIRIDIRNILYKYGLV